MLGSDGVKKSTVRSVWKVPSGHLLVIFEGNVLNGLRMKSGFTELELMWNIQVNFTDRKSVV